MLRLHVHELYGTLKVVIPSILDYLELVVGKSGLWRGQRKAIQLLW